MNYKQIVFVKEEIRFLESVLEWLFIEGSEYSNEDCQNVVIEQYESRINAWKRELTRLVKTGS